MGLVGLVPVRIEQRIVFVGVAMRPTVDGDRDDVARRIESAVPEDARELIADVALERREVGGQQLPLSGAELLSRLKTRPARRARHPHEDRLVGRTHALIIADVDHGVETHRVVVGSRRVNVRDAERLERAPVAERNRRVDERRLDQRMERLALPLRHFRAEVRDHAGPAGDDCGVGPRRVKGSVARVGHLDLSRPIPADVAKRERGAAEPDAHGRAGAVELAIVGARSDDVLGALARHRRREELAHQEARDRGVAVREMKMRGAPGLGVSCGGESHMRRSARLKIEPLKAREIERPHLERPDRLNSHSPLLVRHCLEIGQDPRIGLYDLGEIVGVAHPREPRLLLVRGEAGQVIALLLVDLGDVGRNRRRERGVAQELGPRLRACADDQPVGAEGLAVEEQAALKSKRGVEIALGAALVERDRIDAELPQKRGRDDAVGSWTVDRPRPTVRELGSAAEEKFVALAWPPKSSWLSSTSTWACGLAAR